MRDNVGRHIGLGQCVVQIVFDMAGACVLLRKTQSGQELLHAIQMAADGGRWMESQTACRPISTQEASPPAPDAGMYETLTRREVEVIRELLAGHANKEIGRKLGLREQTVKNIVSRLLRKLQLHDRVQIALHAVETRLLERYADLLT